MNDTYLWDKIKCSLHVGSRVSGTVVRHAAYGIFVEIPDVPFTGLVQVTDFKDSGRMTFDEYPAIGSQIETVVLGFKEAGQQVWLGMKPSQLARRHGSRDDA